MFEWDMGSRRCVRWMTDEGCVGGTRVSVCSQWMACGSSTGIVNMYSLEEVRGIRGVTDGAATGDSDSFAHSSASASAQYSLKPLYTMQNLVTPVTSLAFAPGDEMLLAASAHVEKALKLVSFLLLHLHLTFRSPSISNAYPVHVGF